MNAMREGRIKLMPMVALLAALSLSSCLEDVGNVTSVPDIPAVVVSVSSGTILNTGSNAYGLVYVPELAGRVVEGDYLYVTLKFDWDNQPVSSDYNCQASLLEYEKMEHAVVNISTGALDADFNDSIVGCTSIDYIDNISVRRYNLLMRMWQRAPKNQDYEYQLVCNLDSISKDTNGDDIYSLYLLAKKVEPVRSGSFEDFIIPYGFDISKFVARGTQGDYLKLVIKYISGNDAHGNPVYEIFKPRQLEYFTILVPEY